jgi:hypothetical protein
MAIDDGVDDAGEFGAHDPAATDDADTGQEASAPASGRGTVSAPGPQPLSEQVSGVMAQHRQLTQGATSGGSLNQEGAISDLAASGSSLTADHARGYAPAGTVVQQNLGFHAARQAGGVPAGYAHVDPAEAFKSLVNKSYSGPASSSSSAQQPSSNGVSDADAISAGIKAPAPPPE